MKFIYYFLAIICVFLFITSFSKQKNDLFDFSQKVIDECIKVHGGKAFAKAYYSFDFRDKSFEYQRNKDEFKYSRSYKDKAGDAIKDVLTNQNFVRTVNGQVANLDDKKRRTHSDALNSVHYFAFLPYFLNDAAAKKKYLGLVTIKDIPYHKIQVTFNEEGGGTDHDDVFIYWIREGDFTLDYLAYSYQVNGGGVRFREAYNQRKVGKIRFQDYINYKHEDKRYPVEKMDEAFMDGKLKEVSRIDLVNVKKLSGKK